ncbi:MAG: efflux RND transporter periplasmic adaptor subunit [Deltaproteobacteria bacterium]|nr:efflux RND transporter periplasmic adaptor subunit [Deltaproteobacteria bacterium]
MKKWAVIVVVLAGLGLATGRLLRGGNPSHGPSVTTYEVAKQKFVRRVTAEGNLRAVKATRLTAPQNSQMGGALKIAWLAPDGTYVKKGDVVVRFDPSEPEKQLRDGQADLAAADAKLAEEGVKSKAAVKGRETDADLAADELDQQKKFQSKDEQIFSKNQIVESQIDEGLAQAKQQHAEQAKQVEKHLSHSNAAVISVERQKAELAISHAKSALEAMQIVAPHDGIFVLRRNWRGELPKLGQALWPGEEVGEIPLLDSMEAEVFVLEVDGTGLAEKQAAEIVVEARPELTYTGKIRLVEKLAQSREPGSPVQYFAVVVELDKTDRDVMKPGQRVKATLVLDQQDAVVVPRQAVFDRDGKTVVYRRKADSFEPVPVELGAATSGRVVIKTGLNPGDTIALRDPTQSATGSGSAGSGVP